MSEFYFPETGTTVTWPRYRNGDMTIAGRIPFGKSPIMMHLYIPRQGFRMLSWLSGASPQEHLDHEARRIASALSTYANGVSGWPSRRVYVLPTGSWMWARLRIRRDHLILLDRLLNQPGAYWRLRLAIRMFFLPNELLDWSRRLPRGRSKRSWPLKRSLPFAFLAARLLLEQSRRDEKLRREVQEAIEDDGISFNYVRQFQDASDTFQQLAWIVALVDRAFRPVWERYGLSYPCSGDDPREALRSHYYGMEFQKYYGMESQKHQVPLKELKALDPGWEENLTYFAKSVLLGPPGTAARQYDLLK